MPLRTVLFIDEKNVYHGARRAFFASATRFTDGGFEPLKLGQLLALRAPAGQPSRELSEIRLYTGRPDPSRQPKAAAAHDRQVAAWKQSGLTVVDRPLRYIGGQAQQKGVDVALAIDVVTMAIDGRYDVGIIFSSDSDLRPPIEYVVAKCRGVHLEVAAWRAAKYGQRLSISSRRIWCHWLSRTDYDAVADVTDYSL